MQHQVTLKNGDVLPAIGQGTWYLGEHPNRLEQEMDGIRKGAAAGLRLIDTAEMYGNGAAEKMVGGAIRTLDRGSLYIVSKVLPGNAGGRALERALDGSLARLGTDYLDLYLYHWRGSYPLEETVAGLEAMKKKGKIRAWGVSNFDTDDMEELWSVPGGRNCQVNQVLYHVGSRGIEYDLIPWMRAHQVALMAYCPLAQAGTLSPGLFHNRTLEQIAENHKVPVTEILLSWVIRNGHTIAIPRSSRAVHTLSNAHADTVFLTEQELTEIDAACPAPDRKVPLDIQ
ncbi:MAG: aldo/keto reductase [Bilifractor sp.]|jgi:diketogulonate reductase-like aldo/keto reductase